MRRVASSYIAGTSLGDAATVVARLNAEGKRATIAVLGEEIALPEEAEAIASEYKAVLAAIVSDGLVSSVSIKLTALGLKLDDSELCWRLTSEIVDDAHARGLFVRIDMEDASCVDETLALYRQLRSAGSENVGIVLQACLRRTLADIADLADLRPSVRLCKGIYTESPAIAYRDPGVIRKSYVAALDALLECGCSVAAATHDEHLLRAVQDRFGRGESGRHEIEMLLGVREGRASELVANGHAVRVYVPYGRRWYEYSLRRLQESPQVAGHVVGDVVRRTIGRG